MGSNQESSQDQLCDQMSHTYTHTHTHTNAHTHTHTQSRCKIPLEFTNNLIIIVPSSLSLLFSSLSRNLRWSLLSSKKQKPQKNHLGASHRQLILSSPNRLSRCIITLKFSNSQEKFILHHIPEGNNNTSTYLIGMPIVNSILIYWGRCTLFFLFYFFSLFKFLKNILWVVFFNFLVVCKNHFDWPITIFLKHWVLPKLELQMVGTWSVPIRYACTLQRDINPTPRNGENFPGANERPCQLNMHPKRILQFFIPLMTTHINPTQTEARDRTQEIDG